jgi:hypothetical protein
MENTNVTSRRRNGIIRATYRQLAWAIVCMISTLTACASTTTKAENMDPQISKIAYTPSKGIEEVFLSIPAEYVTPPGIDESMLSNEKRLELLSGTSDALGKLKLNVKDIANGFLSYNMETTAGIWLTEVTYFLNAANQKLIAVNHVWQGEVSYSHALYFLEAWNEMWMEHREGVVPQIVARDFWKGDGPMPSIPMATGTKPSPFALQGLLYQLPRKGKTLTILPPQTANGSVKGFEGSLVLNWKDGIFGPENGVIDLYASLPSAFLTINESDDEVFLAIPKDKESASNRMRVVTFNNSLAGRIRLGSHPDVIVYEGYVDLCLMSQLEGRETPLLVTLSTCGVGDCGFNVRCLEQQSGKWVEVTKQVFSGIELSKVNAAYKRLPSDNKFQDQLALGNLLLTFDPEKNAILVGPNVDAYDADEQPVLLEIQWDGKRFTAK